MENYFYDSLASGFGNVIHTVHGSVGIAVFSNDEGTKVQPVAYDVSTSMVNQMTEEEKLEHRIFSKIYDISDVSFSDEITVYKKLHDIILDIEKTLY